MARKGQFRKGGGRIGAPAKRKSGGSRRKMHGVRRRRRMNAASTGLMRNGVDVLQVGIGTVLGGMAIGAASKLTPNVYIRGGAVALVGVLGAKMVPQMRSVMLGVGAAGVATVALSAASAAGLSLPGAMNATRRLTPEQMQKLKLAADKARMNGNLPPVMNGDLPPVMNKSLPMVG